MYLLEILQEPSRMVIKFLLCNWVPMHMAVFFFFMISELVHGCWKGFILVPEGKLGSGSRGFGFHLQKAIAPETLAVKLPSLSVLKSTVEKFRQQNSKSFLLATVEARKESN